VKGSNQTAALIEELVRRTGASDARTAIRIHARNLLDQYRSAFGELTTPVNVDVLASLRGIRRSADPPRHSEDAELSPDGHGGVTMRVNPDRPLTRQRFSVAHEITHTFFPDYKTKSWCRTDARYRDSGNPDDFLEMLCDIGAAELLFPDPSFTQVCDATRSASDLVQLATDYCASREATLRRYAEVTSADAVAVFFSWKLKPTQQGRVGNAKQINLFGLSAEEEMKDAIRLRIDYAIPSAAFQASGRYLPKDKSVPSDGPIYQAAATGTPADAECHIDFGQASGIYRIAAVPLWTAEEELGPKGENAVAAVLTPISLGRPKQRQSSDHRPKLFG
jgi:Zn-dependent peptidase ImmA (M78 family)